MLLEEHHHLGHLVRFEGVEDWSALEASSLHVEDGAHLLGLENDGHAGVLDEELVLTYLGSYVPVDCVLVDLIEQQFN